jgi:hypothetical protein
MRYTSIAMRELCPKKRKIEDQNEENDEKN